MNEENINEYQDDSQLAMQSAEQYFAIKDVLIDLINIHSLSDVDKVFNDILNDNQSKKEELNDDRCPF